MGLSERHRGEPDVDTGSPLAPEAVSAVSLSVLAARSRPVTAAAARLIEVHESLAELLPEGGLRRSSTVGVGAAAPGSSSLVFGLMAAASSAGSWCAAVGMPDLGLVAAAQLGVALERLALVPDPGEQWPVVVAALLESADIVVVRPAGRVNSGDARRLAARVRERGAVLVVVDPAGKGGGVWPERTDLRLEVTAGKWTGLGSGYGYLRSRELEVTVTGRRIAARSRTARIQLPASDGPATALASDPTVNRDLAGENRPALVQTA